MSLFDTGGSNLTSLLLHFVVRFVLGCIFWKYIFPKGMTKEPPTMDLASAPCPVGAPGAKILQNSMKFHGTTPGLWWPTPGPENMVYGPLATF